MKEVKLLLFNLILFISFSSIADKPGYYDDNYCDTRYNIALSTIYVCPQKSLVSTNGSPKMGVRIVWNPIIFPEFFSTNASYALGDGECLLEVGLPTIRYCARLASPSYVSQDLTDPTKTTRIEADPGYTAGLHINDQGKRVADSPIIYEQYIEKNTKLAYDQCLDLINNDEIFKGQDTSICQGCSGKDNCIIKASVLSSMPKICLYNDPWVADLSGDLFDWDPHFQPLHSGKGLSPIISAIITILKAGGSIAELFGEGGDDVLKLMFPGAQSVIEWICDGISKVASIIGDDIVSFLQKFGELNKIAYPIGTLVVPGDDDRTPIVDPNKSNGACAEVPLGPNPPPYCSDIDSCNTSQPIPASVTQICPTTLTGSSIDRNGILTQTLTTKTNNQIITQQFQGVGTNQISRTTQSAPNNNIVKCISPDLPPISNEPVNIDLTLNPLRNNFINNSLNVSYSWIIQSCKYDYDNSQIKQSDTDSEKAAKKKDNENYNAGMCVRFNGVSEIQDSNSTSVISPCSDTQTSNCVYISDNATKSPLTSYRLIYKPKIDNTTHTLKFQNRLVGIDLGDFKNVTLSYNSTYPSNVSGGFSTKSTISDSTSTYLQLSFQLYDITNNPTNYIALIDPYGSYINSGGPQPNQICVYRGDSPTIKGLVGCVQRATAPQMQIYDCSLGKGGNICNSDIKNPAGIIGMEIGIDSVYSIIGGISNPNSISVTSGLDFLGMNVKSFITDDSVNYPPFDSSDTAHVINEKTIIGDYYPSINPSQFTDNQLSQMPKIDEKNHQYLNGLEYYNNQYKYGGKYICLYNSNSLNCPNNPQDCVLAKLKDVSCIRPSKDNPNPDPKTQCVASNKLSDRQWPNYDSTKDLLGQILAENQCYVPDSYVQRLGGSPGQGQTIIDNSLTSLDSVCIDYGKQPAINSDSSKGVLTAIRNKDPIEQGLCIAIPQPDPCSAITENDDNNATWPLTNYGEQSKGTCMDGYLGSPMRYCLVDTDSGISSFGPVISGSCQPKFCKAISNPGPNDGNATWLDTPYDASAIGTCINGYSGNPTRSCNVLNQDGTVSFADTISPCIQDITPSCPAWTDPDTGIYCPPANLNDTTQCKCPNNAIEHQNNPPRATCTQKNGSTEFVVNVACVTGCNEWTYNNILYPSVPFGQKSYGQCIYNNQLNPLIPSPNNPPYATCYISKPSDPGQPGFDDFNRGQCIRGCQGNISPDSNGILWDNIVLGGISVGKCSVGGEKRQGICHCTDTANCCGTIYCDISKFGYAKCPK